MYQDQGSVAAVRPKLGSTADHSSLQRVSSAQFSSVSEPKYLPPEDNVDLDAPTPYRHLKSSWAYEDNNSPLATTYRGNIRHSSFSDEEVKQAESSGWGTGAAIAHQDSNRQYPLPEDSDATSDANFSASRRAGF